MIPRVQDPERNMLYGIIAKQVEIISQLSSVVLTRGMPQFQQFMPSTGQPSIPAMGLPGAGAIPFSIPKLDPELIKNMMKLFSIGDADDDEKLK